MMDEPHLFVAAAVRELALLRLTYPLYVIRTLDPEDDVPRLDFHITGVPKNIRRQVEDLLLGCLVECEQDVGFANAIPFVHDSGFNAADLDSIGGERLAVFEPSVRPFATSTARWRAPATVEPTDARIGVAA